MGALDRREFLEWVKPVVIVVALPAHAQTSAPVPPPFVPPVEPPLCEIPPVQCDEKNKITICHTRPNGNPQTISVSCDEQTLCDHIGHGDDITSGSCKTED